MNKDFQGYTLKEQWKLPNVCTADTTASITTISDSVKDYIEKEVDKYCERKAKEENMDKKLTFICEQLAEFTRLYGIKHNFEFDPAMTQLKIKIWDDFRDEKYCVNGSSTLDERSYLGHLKKLITKDFRLDMRATTSTLTISYIPTIKRVIFNDPATIIFWSDNTKTVVKAQDEAYDPEKGMAMAIAKKALGNQGNYCNIFKKWLPEEEEETIYVSYADGVEIIKRSMSNMRNDLNAMIEKYGNKNETTD